MIWYIVYFLLIPSALIYLSTVLGFYSGLFQLTPGRNNCLHSVSIIVPARNEASHIAHCLDSLIAQDYPKEKIEVIVVDDSSSDETARLVETYVRSQPLVKLVQLKDDPRVVSPKKRAIHQGILASQHEIIFTTDADCIAQPGWLKTMMRHFEDQVGMVVGLTLFDKEKGWFQKIQSLEFLALVTCGAGSIGNGRPLIANGANLAYRKKVFDQVAGFQGIDLLTSGDDDLLMQKIATQTDWKVRFAAEAEAVIFTTPMADLASFLNQRTRWASKSIHYRNPCLVAFLVATYIFYLTLFITPPLSLIHLTGLPLPIAMFLAKLVVDFLMVFKGCQMTRRTDLLKYFPLTEVLQIPYILYVGLAGLRGKFHWKGR